MSNDVGLYLRKRNKLFYNSEYEVFDKFKYYDYSEVALLSIGIWNGHSCLPATERIHDLAERANIFIEKMRNNGSHVIHGGSYSNYSCKEGDWDETNLRQNIKGKPMAKLIDKGFTVPPIPIDDSDGGFDKKDKNYDYDRSNITIHPAIKVDYQSDCISDNAKEILNYLYDKNIKCLLAFGTHTNMCVLDKPYGVKHFVRYGFPVIIVRDLCDAMYNPQMPPFVDIEEANNIMSEWVEKYLCPTISSTEAIDLNKRVIMVDIDNTITVGKGYEECQPRKDVISKLNSLHKEGCNIIYWTARGIISDNDWYDHTKKQLDKWGASYNMLITKKPYFDKFLEDKSINLDTNMDDFYSL